MRIQQFLVSIGLLVTCGLSSVWADSLPDDFSLPTEFELFGGMHAKEITLANLDNCEPLLEKIGSEAEAPKHSTKANFYGELYDRGLCVEKDPARAFYFFEAAISDYQEASYAVLGWKYTYGHGVEQSDEKAKQAFKNFFSARVLNMFDRPVLEEGYDGLRGRSQPPEFHRMKNWYDAELATKEQKVTFLREILRGTAAYYDGSPVTKEKPYVGSSLLPIIAGNAIGRYYYAIEMMEHAKTDKEKKDAILSLFIAAMECHPPAMIKYADIKAAEFSKTKNQRALINALRYYHQVIKLGIGDKDTYDQLYVQIDDENYVRANTVIEFGISSCPSN